MKWVSICFTMDLESKFFEASINNVYSNQSILSENDLVIRKGGSFYFAQEQDLLDGGFSPAQSLRGQIAEFYMLDFILKNEEMSNFHKCGFSQEIIQDAVISFSNLNENFEVSKVKVTYGYENDNPCSTVKSEEYTIILAEPRIRDDAVSICHSLGAILAVPKNKEENSALFDQASKFHNECFTSTTDYLWIGAVGEESDQTLRHYFSSKKLTNIFTIFKENITDNNCASMWASLNDLPLWYGGWKLTDCSVRKCTPCYFERKTTLKLRGLCAQSFFDKAYTVYQFDKNITFLGNYHSVIVKTPVSNLPNDYGYWEMHSYSNPGTLARTPLKSPTDYPTGKKTWLVENDNCGLVTMDLILTICKTGQFTCTDGSCIPLQKRCDLETNCPDASDEDDCLPLILPNKYSSAISPPRESSSKPVEVKVFVAVFSMRSFELTNFRFVTDAEVTMMWNDKRLKFRNLKNTLNLNNMGTIGQQLWLPHYELLGGDNTSCNIHERIFSLRAKRVSLPLPDDDQNVGEGKKIDTLIAVDNTCNSCFYYACVC